MSTLLSVPSQKLEYDFDVHGEKSYYRFFVKSYMEMVHSGLQEISYSFAGKIVYDIGVGRGRAFPIYQSLGIKKVIGFDVEANEVAFAQEKAKKFGIDLTVHMNPGNEALKKVPDESCDVVSLMYVLMCVPPEIKMGMIREAKRIVKPGGLVIIMDVPRFSLMSGLNKLAHMPRTFSSIQEWKSLFHPLKMIKVKGSNYWYFFNKPMDILGKCFGTTVYHALDCVPKALCVTPSTSLMIFQK